MRLFLLIFVLPFSTYSQNIVTGNVSDLTSGEYLIGASVIYESNKGTTTDFDGNFRFSTDKKSLTLKISYVGYESLEKKIELNSKLTSVDFRLSSIKLNEVRVIADLATERKTPVAFSTIPMKKINEELASQEIPMVLNSTPGVYATQTGGGDGDARITIRGFNQRNVAVMIDGIPVNDMENGWVYWSNWFGLDAVTSNIQVQRGLGASKIAIPSVGGTMNIITRGTGNKAGGSFKQEIGSFGKIRSSLGYNSGKLKNGWGFTLAGSYKQGNGFVDQTWTEGYFYYAKLQKEIGNHLISLSVMGAPQKHGQRSYKSNIATYDTTIARELGDTSNWDNQITNKGITYNKHWGKLNRWQINNSGDTLNNRERLNTRQNYYHKPQYSLRHFWRVNEKFYLSNVSYLSVGNGGGTRISGNTNNYDTFGQYNLQEAYDANVNNIDLLYSDNQNKGSTYLSSSINNHFWYGLLSTMNYEINGYYNLSGGLDFRYYTGQHYREVYDLLGADYVIDESNEQRLTSVKKVGDKVSYHNDGIVRWGGAFSQIEYSNGMLSAFFNLSASNSGYKRIDYFKKRDLVLSDTTYREALGTSVTTNLIFDDQGNLVGANKTQVLDTIVHNGVAYTMNSDEAKLAETNWKNIPGFTIKTGANYNLDDKNNVFLNLGYLSKAPRFNNVYDYSNRLYRDIKNESVSALELGYSFRSSVFSSNLNMYYTIWNNKPSNGGITVTIDDIPFRANINGMDALHKGIELDLSCKLLSNLSLEGLLSIGDWRWTSTETVRFYDDDNSIALDPNSGDTIEVSFDADGVRVGDAAQTQLGFSLRYEPTTVSYVKLRYTFFDDYFADFDPISLGGENGGRDSWQIPSYDLIDLHCGYNFKLNQKNKLSLRLSILNLFDNIYVSDAQNNDPYNDVSYQDFDAKSASVFFGLGRRFTMSARLNF